MVIQVDVFCELELYLVPVFGAKQPPSRFDGKDAEEIIGGLSPWLKNEWDTWGCTAVPVPPGGSEYRILEAEGYKEPSYVVITRL